MKTINKQSENMGGVIRMWAIPSHDIQVLGNQAIIISDAEMVDIYTQAESAVFNEELGTAFAGQSYKVDITAVVPCDNKDTQLLIAEMERRSKYLVIYQDGNERYKLAGTEQVPLRFGAKQTTGQGASALNHYQISFAGQQRERAVFIDNPFV
jgi:hypothetical protein